MFPLLVFFQGSDSRKICYQMTVTWTSGYNIYEAEPFVEWGVHGGEKKRSPAGTLTFDRHSMCGWYSYFRSF